MKLPQRNTIQFWLLAMLPAGILFSRVLLSCCLIGFITLACVHRELPAQFRRLLKDRLLAGTTLLFFIPLISGLWSEDMQTWSGLLRIKLPLLLLPLSFAGSFRITPKQHRILSLFFIGAVLAGSIQTIVIYAGGVINDVNEAYLRSKVMFTPMYDDHVRFSWMVSLAALLAVWLGMDRWKEQRWISIGSFLTAAWLVIFLHLLAARTGILSLYIMLLVAGIYTVLRVRKPVISLAVIFLAAALPVIAYQTMPSFRNRMRVSVFEYDYFKHLDYLPGSNDAVRMISIRAGWELMQSKPLTGSGFGDVKSDAYTWYGRQYPQMLESDKKIPGSEWVVYGAGAGWPGLILFGAILLLPFFCNTRLPWVWWSFHLTAAMSLLIDVGLEIQIGVALYVFVYGWWRAWLLSKNNPSLQAV